MLKKLFLIGACSLICMGTFSTAHPIVSRVTKDGGWFGYNYTHTTLDTYTYYDELGSPHTGRGWNITCTDPGWSGCPKAKDLEHAPSGHVDAIDLIHAQDLEEYADDQVANDNPNGTHTKRVQVEGETFERVYVLTWSTASDGTLTVVVDYSEAALEE